MTTKIIASYCDSDYDEEDYDYEYDYEYVTDEANILLDSNTNHFVRVIGMNHGWRGSSRVDVIIRETKLDEIVKNYIKVDQLSIEVYEDRVEITNAHHDGTNRYALYPFSLNDLTRDELKKYIDNQDDYNSMRYKNSYSRALKDELIEYIEQYDLHLIIQER